MSELIDIAQSHARRLGHNYIGTELILLAMSEHRIGIASNALAAASVRPRHLRPAIEAIIGRGSGPVAWEVPFTPRAKRILELSWKIAVECGDNFIASEHFLLAMLDEGQGAAIQALETLGVDLELLRADVRRRIEFRQKYSTPSDSGALTFKSEADKNAHLQRLQDQIRSWHNRAWMAKQQGKEDLVSQALEHKWKYERQFAEAKSIEPPEEPEDPDDLQDPDSPGNGPPPQPSGVPRRPRPIVGGTEDMLPLPQSQCDREEDAR